MGHYVSIPGGIDGEKILPKKTKLREIFRLAVIWKNQGMLCFSHKDKVTSLIWVSLRDGPGGLLSWEGFYGEWIKIID